MFADASHAIAAKGQKAEDRGPRTWTTLLRRPRPARMAKPGRPFVSGAKGAGMGRVPTGIPGLNTVLNSGFLQRSVHTAQDMPGAAKDGQPGLGPTC